MIHGSTFSAALHMTIFALLFFGFPDLSITLPTRHELPPEKPVEFVMMSDREADQLDKPTSNVTAETEKTAQATESAKPEVSPNADEVPSEASGPVPAEKDNASEPEIADTPPTPNPLSGPSTVTEAPAAPDEGDKKLTETETAERQENEDRPDETLAREAAEDAPVRPEDSERTANPVDPENKEPPRPLNPAESATQVQNRDVARAGAPMPPAPGIDRQSVESRSDSPSQPSEREAASAQPDRAAATMVFTDALSTETDTTAATKRPPMPEFPDRAKDMPRPESQKDVSTSAPDKPEETAAANAASVPPEKPSPQAAPATAIAPNAGEEKRITSPAGSFSTALEELRRTSGTRAAIAEQMEVASVAPLPTARAKSVPETASAGDRDAGQVPAIGVENPLPGTPGGEVKIAQQGIEGGAPVPSAGDPSPESSVSQIVEQLVESLPRLKHLREELAKADGAERASPALETTIDRLQKRTDEGFSHAQFALAEMYLTGNGLPRDTEKAVSLLNRAAMGGYMPAQLALGMLAAEGKGMEKNLAETHTWWAISAEQGSKPAEKALPELEQHMSTRETVEARKRNYQLRQVLVIIHGGDLKNASKAELGNRLRIAATLGDVESVHILLAQGADADGRDIDGRTAMIEAAWRGYPRIVKALIDNGANLSATDNSGKTALMWAAINGHWQVCANLIVAGTPVDAQDNEGLTALMRAAWNGHKDTVRTLLNAGAGWSLKDKKGLTALDYSVKEGNKDIQTLLQLAARG